MSVFLTIWLYNQIYNVRWQPYSVDSQKMILYHINDPLSWFAIKTILLIHFMSHFLITTN